MNVARRSLSHLIALVLALAVGLGVGLPVVAATAAPAPLAAPDDGKLRVLLFYKDNFHLSHVQARQAVRDLTAELATQYSQTVEIQETDNAAAFTTENLATHDAVVFAQTGGVLFNDEQRAALEAYIRGGGGYVGLHYAGWSVGTSEHDVNPFYLRLVGAMSEGHPENPGVRPGRVVVKDTGHPLTQGLPAEFTRSDEWYDWTINPAPQVRTLLEADEESYGGGKLGTSHPITWCQQIDAGRSWYSGMGHEGSAYSEPNIRTQMRHGLAYAAGLLPADCSPPSKAEHGAMSEVTPWPLMPINAALTSDGTVQSFGSTPTPGCTDGAPYDWDGNRCISQGGQFEIDIWNPEVPRTLANVDHGLMPNATYTDLFCSMQVQDPHRKATMTVGGDDGLGANDPNDAAIGVTTYTTNNGLQNDAPMNLPRWYPTGTTMPNGDVVVQGGALRGGPGGPGVLTPEIRTDDDRTGWRLLTGARSPVAYGDGGSDHPGEDENRWWYPRAFVAPGSGNLFNISGTQMFELDPSGDGELTLRGTLPAGVANQGALGNPVGATSTATMYRPGKILQVGGGDWDNGGGPDGARAGLTVDVTGPGGTAEPIVEATAPMRYRRHWATSTVLPDGDVLVTGGSRQNNGGGGVVTSPEIWDPETGEWTTVEVPQAHARLYHSTALLLPDGRVMIGGGGAPGPRDYTDVEYYSPAYLFDGEEPAARPEITEAPEEIGYDGTFDLTSSAEVSRVTLVRNGSVTHSFNNDQNFQDLEFTQDQGKVTITAPADGTYAPPGAYMLFVFDADGTPSVASMMDLDPEVAMDVRTPQVVDQFEYPRVPADWRGGNPAAVVDVPAGNGRMAPWAVDRPVQLVRARNEANGGLGATGYHLALGGAGSLERPIAGLDVGREYRLSLRYARDGRATGTAPASARLAIGSLDATLTATTERSSRTGFDTYVGTFTADTRSEVLTLSQTGPGAGMVLDDLVVVGVEPGLVDVPVRYQFEEGEGDSAANTGTDDSVGAARLTGTAGWSPNGVLGNALELQGGANESAVDLPDNLLQGEESFTTSMWVRPDTKDKWINLFHIGDGLGAAGSFFQIQMQTQANGNTGLAATFKAKGSALEERIYAVPTRDVDVNTWNHVAFTREGATGTLYLNGEPIATRGDLTIDMTDVGPTANNWLGRNGFPDPAFDGLMDEVRVYRSALTATDVEGLYAEGASLRTTTTVTVDPASPSAFGAPLTVTARVVDEQDAAAGGQAELWVDGERVGEPVTLAAGTATFSGLNLTPGEHEIEVRYLAADGWRPSRTSVTHTVERPPPGEGVPIHYAFDEGTGRSAANTGSDPSVGAATLLGETSWTEQGRHANAVSLPGGPFSSSNYVDLPDNIDAGMDEEFTVSLWTRPDALPTWVPLLQIGSSTDTFFLLQSSTRAGPNGSPTGFAATFKAPGNATQERLTLGAGNDLPLTEWTHVVFTMKGSTGRIYFDGELMATRDNFTLGIGDVGVGGNTTVNALGSTSWEDPKFDGLIDDFRMYGYELAEEDVAELYEAPVAGVDSYSTAHATALTVPAPGVLANDSDAQDDALTATEATEPAHGDVTLNPDGSFTYRPDAGFSGTDRFTYEATGGGLSSGPTAVTITVREPAATRVTATSARVTYGRPGAVSVTVSPAAATGRVSVLSGTRVLASGALTGGRSSVVLPARSLAPGTHRLTVRYAGDGPHAGSTGTVQVVVAKAAPGMRVQAPSRVKRGKRATVKVTLSAPGVALTGRVRVTFQGKRVTGTVRGGRVVLRLPKAGRVGLTKVTVAYLGSPLAAAVTKTVRIRVTR